MRKTLERLESALRRVELDGAYSLRPGLERSAIYDRTAQLRYPLPEQLVELYGWHDGGGRVTPGMDFNPLDDALRSYDVFVSHERDLGDQEGNLLSWRADWFPVFSNSYCDAFVMCGPVEHGSLWQLCHQFLELSWVSDSLAQFLLTIAVAVELGGLIVDPRRGKGLDLRPAYDALRPGSADVEALVRALNQQDSLESLKAVGKLRQWRLPEAVDPTLDLLNSQNASVVRHAATVLISYEDPKATAAVIEAAARWVARRAETSNPALDLIPHGPFAEDSHPLIDALHSPLEDLRAAAAMCLGELSDARVFVDLQAAASSDPSPVVQAAARGALKRLQR